jgi:hypothetical protein
MPMDKRKNENQERGDEDLSEELEDVREMHPEWEDEKAGDDAEGANP